MALQQAQPPEIEMVSVEAGEFAMGWNSPGEPEHPAHTVHLQEYRIGRYPVTNAQFLPFLEDTGHRPPPTWPNAKYPRAWANHPVSGLTWSEAWLYCAWLRHKTHRSYHLPTEAQWEKAATWDPKSQRKLRYPWGDKFEGTSCNLGTSGGKTGKEPPYIHGIIAHGTILGFQQRLASGKPGTTPVGKYSPRGDSPHGCADMIGNVNEWCNTAMWHYPYNPEDGREELGARGRRCIRGGDWFTGPFQSGVRRDMPSDAWRLLWGFRVATSSALDDAHQELIAYAARIIHKARLAFEAALEKEPGSAQLYYDWGSSLIPLLELGMDQYTSEIEAILGRAIESTEGHEPESGGALTSPVYHLYYNRGLVRTASKDFRGAFEDFTRAAELEASDADVFLMRARSACELENWEQAQRDLDEGIRLGPKPSAWLGVLRGWILKGRGAMQEALRVFTDVIEQPLLNPLLEPRVHWWRADVYDHLGKSQEALSDRYHYLLWRPEDDRAKEALQRANPEKDLRG